LRELGQRTRGTGAKRGKEIKRGQKGRKKEGERATRISLIGNHSSDIVCFLNAEKKPQEWQLLARGFHEKRAGKQENATRRKDKSEKWGNPEETI